MILSQDNVYCKPFGRNFGNSIKKL